MSERRNMAYLFMVLVMLLVPFALAVVPTRAAGTTFVVSSTADTGGSCASTPTACTLRQAIESANADAGANTITFSFAGSGNITITPASVLPALTDVDTTISGLLNTGFQPRIIVDGGGTLSYGLSISATADRTIVEKLIFTGFRGQGAVPFGAALYVNGADNVIVRGSYVGNLPGTAFTSAQANRIGVFVSGGSGTTIGGAQDTDRNIISGNTGDGVVIADASGTTLLNNFIGVALEAVSPFRATLLGNGGNGVQVATSTGVTVGGSKPNVISANTLNGILVTGSTASGNTISSNYIGTDENGATYGGLDFGNGDDGVQVAGGAKGTILLGAGAASPTLVISDNAKYGVRVTTTASGTQISNALIGITSSGTADLGNTLGGVALLDDSATTTVGPGNIISGNDGPGITVKRTSVSYTGVAGTRIVGNLIGLDTTRAATLPNTGAGIDVQDNSSNTLIGSQASPNYLAGNAGAAITIAGTGTVSTTVSSNIIGLIKNATGDTLYLKAAGNTGDGVLVSGGPKRTTVSANTIGSNTGAGVKIAGSSTTTVTLSLNQIGWVVTSPTVTTAVARANAVGVAIDQARTVSVLTSTIQLNTGAGISVTNALTITIRSNTQISRNGGDGVLVNGASSNVKVLSNVLASNVGQGVKVDGTSKHVTIQSNRMLSNAGGVQLVGSTRYSGSGADTANELTKPNHGIDPPVDNLASPLRIRLNQNGLVSGFVYTTTNTIKDERTVLPASACISCTIQFFSSEGTINDGQGFTPLRVAPDGGAQSDFLTPDARGFFRGTLVGVTATSLPRQIVFAATDGYGNSSEFGVLNVTPSLSLSYTTPNNGRQSAAPGQTIAYTLSLLNNGTIDFDTMSVVTSGTLPRWLSSPLKGVPTLFSLPAGASKPLTVTLTLPTGTDASVHFPIADTTTLTAQVTGQTPVTKTLVTTVLATPVVSSAPITGTLGSGDPGKIVTYGHRFTNSGNVSVTLDLTRRTVDAADSGKIWTTALTTTQTRSDQVTLLPGGKVDVGAQVTVPLGATVLDALGKPVKATTFITATAQGFPISVVVSDTTRVSLAPGATVTGNGQLKEAEAFAQVSFSHSVVNTSNGRAAFCLNYRSNSGSQVVSFISQNSVVISPFGNCFTLDTIDDPLNSKFTTLRFAAVVKVTGKLIAGSTDGIEIFVTSLDINKEVANARATDSVKVTVSPKLPALWLPITVR